MLSNSETLILIKSGKFLHGFFINCMTQKKKNKIIVKKPVLLIVINQFFNLKSKIEEHN